ncbi:hypothetical protein GCK32_014575 [Trichostrongylus colubriformis]|uniref:Uncharacterized protein n=1 Tax=Trichostrongylus colubriformis TaxID=6319 RepID=A0AAN8I8Y7_TRICO
MYISAVQLLLFILIYSQAKPQYKDGDISSTPLPTANITITIIRSTNETTGTEFPSFDADFDHNVYDWKTIAIRVGIGGACAFAFIAFFACLYTCFNRGGNKSSERKQRNPEEGYDSDSLPVISPAIDESRELSFSSSGPLATTSSKPTP